MTQLLGGAKQEIHQYCNIIARKVEINQSPIHYREVSIGGVTFRILTFGQLGRKYHFHSLF